MKKTIDSLYGKFNSYHEPEKKRINISIESFVDEMKLLNVIKEHVLSLGLKECYISFQGGPMFQNKEPDYDISSYETDKAYEKVDGYELVRLNRSLYDTYIKITNAATFYIDNMSYVDIAEVLTYVNDDSSNIGLIKYQNDYIGSYVITTNEIESLAIDPKFQEMGHGEKSLQTILSNIEGRKLLLVNSRNIKALNLYLKIGFQKTEKFISYWYHFSY